MSVGALKNIWTYFGPRYIMNDAYCVANETHCKSSNKHHAPKSNIYSSFKKRERKLDYSTHKKKKE